MPTSPYEPPKSASPQPIQLGRNRNLGCFLGISAGGCLIPLLIFGIVIVPNLGADLGNAFLRMLLVIAIPLGVIGGIIGAIFAPRRRHKDTR